MSTRRNFLQAAAAPLAMRGWAQAPAPAVVRAVVAADGSGDFPTIQRAVDHVLDNPPRAIARVILEIRPGTYRERVKVPQDLPRLTLRGQDPATTLITYSMSATAGGGTFFSPATEIDSAEFEAGNLTFENSFGTGSQAVAVSVHSDRARFRNCRFLGWQDTLYAASGRQYYRDCYIAGHVDFIFGNATAVFDGCHIHSRGAGYITAHRRTAAFETTGYVFRNCRLTGEPGLLQPATPPAGSGEVPFPARNSGRGVFLGRPWRPHARVVFLDCAMGDHIRTEGWDNWGKADNERTAWFAELGSTGPGAAASGRVAWARRLSRADAAAFSPEVFLKGTDGWNPGGGQAVSPVRTLLR